MEEDLRLRVVSYHPAEKAARLLRKANITLLVGPSGVGKDSLKNCLLKTGRYHEIISHTTRQPRLNKGVMERDGFNYHFITEAEAIRMLDNQEFIEAKIYNNHLYGTSLAEIEKALKDSKTAVNAVEVQGISEYKKMAPSIVAIFLLPPSFEVWLKRLDRRGDLPAEQVRSRLRTSLSELGDFLRAGYYIGLINDDLDVATRAVQRIEEDPTGFKQRMDLTRHAERLINNIEGYLDQVS